MCHAKTCMPRLTRLSAELILGNFDQPKNLSSSLLDRKKCPTNKSLKIGSTKKQLFVKWSRFFLFLLGPTYQSRVTLQIVEDQSREIHHLQLRLKEIPISWNQWLTWELTYTHQISKMPKFFLEKITNFTKHFHNQLHKTMSPFCSKKWLNTNFKLISTKESCTFFLHIK